MANSLREREIEVCHLDLDDAEMSGLSAVQPIFESIDRVFLLTGYDVRMLAQSKAVADAANAAGVSRIVHPGVGSKTTTIEYSTWYQLIEAYIGRSGIGFTHVWPSAFTQLLPLSVETPGVLTHFIGDRQSNWVDVGDIATVAATVLRDPRPDHGRVYPLAAESASITETANLLGEVTGQRWRYKRANSEVFYKQLVAAGHDPIYMRGSAAISTASPMAR